MLSSITRDDVFIALVIVAFILLVVGLAVLILWLRDRSRDWRGVPEWIRDRGQLRAQRVGLGYRILCLVCVGIACSMQAFEVRAHAIIFLLLSIAAIAFYLVWGDLKLFRGLNQTIKQLNRQNNPANRMN